MQNSGFGNAVNPLASLTDPTVYGIPLLLLIGWRGEPGRKDEPQHIMQGAKTIGFLETMDIPYAVIDASNEGMHEIIEAAVAIARKRSSPYALVVREQTFKPYQPRRDQKTNYPLLREEALTLVLRSIPDTAAVVSTTGMTSREVFEYRTRWGHGHARDFLSVGSMGHASQVALGIALSKPGQEVYCLDGDGAAIMHLGAMAIIGSMAPRNFRHIILNNGAHDSVGGQPTAGFKVDFSGIASACGYRRCLVALSAEELSAAVKALDSEQGPTLLEIKINKGSRKDLGRPTTSPSENKTRFMEFLRQ
jgi:phosphonopyruvate decarboxylase